ncbi:N-acetylglucosamine-specific PTS transporter subunit IIBC [Chromobacterium piscinae]|uniref:N-acetylglucosamine-specific PTS transporter subunit IIBC n=5 Tax=Chromobacterium piscinae TaxID=686831 RepID=A0ABV0H1F2_9NEIS|nr:N-acetylglucosamine-specific PTS transporter subunit IIBC [Chromobacterium vaccinii]MBX9345941.1 N-acetylglucosamine-specific PTS transporter subunit IIBC [Chromobacterium vaccinii]MBX9359599.1 N-acetylglucosamine-specific PTS transporter subunit IIBC [Chromobacterium vaccinii]MCD4502806.1 N-acetylglucosamine-specific PTS transporter subunit IIBC [Chromobacterium piscinae]NHQ81886.1 PTS transporter subunit EIIC [Chromobacterium vaccinii]
MSTLNKFAGIQQLGRALMLPIAVLPVAGLLLRLGQPDLLDIKIMAQAGDAIFGNLALIFAIGVAVGFAKDNNGTSGLAGAIGFLVLTAVLKVIDDKINMGVLSGILSGLIAGYLYNRYKDIKLPSYLAFFGGKRFVPIVTGFSMLILGAVLGYIWPPIQHGIDSVGKWLIGAGEIGVFFYGVLNRILIVTGLHHILNTMVWFQVGDFTNAAGKLVHGDLTRFFAGDKTAGMFMSGFFPVMMFGLPAACLAMYRTAKPENRAAVGGLLFSMALTAMLTGVTEPVEFAFMFLAPALYAIHAVLTGLAMAIMQTLDVKLGFGFSAGLFDYLLNFGLATKPLLLLPVGAAYFIVYYGLFVFFIRKFDLKTPGREDVMVAVAEVGAGTGRARAFIDALGGAANLKSVDACTTRLRLQVASNDKVNEAALKALGSRGLIKPAAGSVQVVLGPEADLIADEIRGALGSAAAEPQAAAPAVAESLASAAAAGGASIDKARWLAALGGAGNVRKIEAVAGSRLRVEVADAALVDQAALLQLGASGVTAVSSSLLHVVLQADAAPYAAVLQG